MKSDVAANPLYRQTCDLEISQNPLLAHLPPEAESHRDAYMRLRQRLNFIEAERDAPNSIRRRRVRSLSNYYLPADPVHARAMMEIHSGIVDSYIQRNPFSSSGQRLLHGRPPPHDFRPGISFITGHSGMGKSRLCDRTMDSLGPQVVKHSTFLGQPFPETQIVWLRRNIPAGCTIGKLCRTFGAHVDNVLHRELYGSSFARLRARSGIDDVYISEFIKLARGNHLGALLFDEFQNLVGLGATGQRVIQFLVNLRDELGIPIIVIGTKKAFRLLEDDFSPARRIGEGGYYELIRPLSADDAVWIETCKNAWAYQWVKSPGQFTQEVSDALYAYSQGVTGVMISLLKNAQLIAIDEELETVNPHIIKRAFEERMGVLHKAIFALSSGDTKLIEQWDDLSKGFWASEQPNNDVASNFPSSPSEGPENSGSDNHSGSPKIPRANRSKKQSTVATSLDLLTTDRIREQVVDASSMQSVIDALR